MTLMVEDSPTGKTHRLLSLTKDALAKALAFVVLTAITWAIAATVRVSAREEPDAPLPYVPDAEIRELELRLREGIAQLTSTPKVAEEGGCRAGITPKALHVPLIPDCHKGRSVQRFWDGMLEDVANKPDAGDRSAGGIVYWHVEQTGGGSLCRVALAENLYSRRFWDRIPEDEREAAVVQLAKTDCRSGYVDDAMCAASGLPAVHCAVGGFSGSVGSSGRGGSKGGYGDASFDTRTWEAQARAGRRFFAMQPADCWDDRDEPCWHCCAKTPYPSAWYTRPWFRDPADEFWTKWVHVVTVRDPVERFYSDYHNRHFRQWWCEIIKTWEGACIDDMLTPAGRASLRQRWDDIGHNGTALLGVVENRLVGNALVMHLSGTPDNLELAKRNLRHMSFVLDFKARREESYFLLRNLLYWSDGEIDSHVARFHDNLSTFKTIRNEQYEALKLGPLALDFALWEYSLGLIDAHAAALGFKPSPQPRASE